MIPTAAVVVEIVSPGDETYDKLPFYAAHRVEEVLIVEPDQHRVHIWTHAGDRYQAAERSEVLALESKDLDAAIRWV